MSHRIALSLVFAGLVWGHAAHAAIRTVGSVSSVQVVTEPTSGNKSALFGLSTGGSMEVTPYATDMVRVRFHWTGLWDKDEIAIAKPLPQWSNAGATFSESGSVYRIETADLVIEVIKSPTVQVNFRDKSGYYLSRDSRMEYDDAYQALNDPTYNNLKNTGTMPAGFKVKAIRKMPAGEAYFGLGENAGPLNRRGRNIQGWNSDTYGWQEDKNPMYMTMPFVYGVQGQTSSNPPYAYGIFFNNPGRPAFRMGTQWNDAYSFEAGDGQIDYFFFGGGASHTMKSVLGRYTELTGKPAMLPKWAFGYHQSRWSYDNQGWVEWLADEFRRQDFPLDAIHIDIDYMDANADWNYTDGTLHQLTFNGRFPDAASMIQRCGNNGVKLIPLIEPFIMTGDPLWNDASAQMHFTKNNNGSNLKMMTWFGELSWLDFTSTGCRTWWRNKVVNFLNQYPFAGIWNDLNEPGDDERTPINALYWMDGAFGGFNPSDSRKWHLNVKNTYVVHETSHTYETMLQKSPNQRPFVLARAGWPGVQRYALGWSGDNTASYDHLRHNIRLGTSVMMSGQVNFGHDIGGFIGDPEPELLTRWYEWGTMNPFCRNHSKKWDGMREPWRFAEPYKSHMRKAIERRYELMPYLYTLAYQSTETGIAMNTPTVMHFPADPETHYQNDYDFMVGDYLLVAPVFQKGANNRWVYLPKGANWYNWYTDQKLVSGWNNVSAPLGTLPMFAREGAIIPMGPKMKFVDEFKPTRMDIEVWPAGTTEFTMYEDDGQTFDYRNNEFAKTRLVSTREPSRWVFELNARQGSYDPGARSFLIAGHDLPAITTVKMNGAALAQAASLNELLAATNGWFYDSSAKILSIKISDTAAAVQLEAAFTPQAQVTWVGHTYNWPLSPDLDPGEPLWINTESSPAGAGKSAALVYSTNGTTWASHAMNRAGPAGSNDWWNANLGGFPAGTTIRYAVAVIDSNGIYTWDTKGGQNYQATVRSPPALTWIGNTYNWPSGSDVNAGETLWINIDSYPRTAARDGFVAYSVNGGIWQSKNLSLGSPVGNNDHWFADIGSYPAGTQIRYAIRLSDHLGRDMWDSNKGQDFKVTVSP